MERLYYVLQYTFFEIRKYTVTRRLCFFEKLMNKCLHTHKCRDGRVQVPGGEARPRGQGRGHQCPASPPQLWSHSHRGKYSAIKHEMMKT